MLYVSLASAGIAAAQNQAEVSHSGHQCATTANGPASTVIETARIQAVTDGDTIVLDDGRRVRVIGINAPELSKTSEQALRTEALQARELIDQLTQKNPEVELVLGEETSDRYGRVLAHVRLADNANMATELLARGLAAAAAVSPNTRCADYYQRVEQSAREQSRGVWQYTDNPWFAPHQNTGRIVGFHVLTNTVDAVRAAKERITLTLANGVKVRTSTTVLPEAKALSLIGKSVEVRGWFGRYNGSTSVKLHHRSNLNNLSATR